MRILSLALIAVLLFSCASSSEEQPASNSEAPDSQPQASRSLPAEIPANGSYQFDLAYAEWQGKSMGETVTVEIKGDSIRVLYSGEGNLGYRRGEVMEEGLIRQHKSGDWIIAHAESDVNAEEYGGCTDGPQVIDFSNKKFWVC